MSTKFNEEEFRILSEVTEESLDSAVKNVENFISYNDGKGHTDQEKDYLYGEAKRLWENYVKVLRDTKFTLYLNTQQFDYFSKILREDIEYDINTIFFGIELTNTLGTWFKQNIESDVELSSYESDPVSFNYINHLISTIKIKGLTDEAYLFSQVLKKVNEIMKVVNFYDNHAKSLSKDIQEWVANFEESNESVPTYNFQNF
jgi:hypothetical protein